MNALEIRGLEKTFGSFSLGPLDLTVPLGSIYGLVGPNGSGKTTTLDLIFGMGAAAAGRITVLGLDHLQDEVAMKSRVGFASPELNYNAWGKVWKAIRFVKSFHADWDDAYCEQLLDAFRVQPDASISTLSYGNRIKLAVILALAWRPQLVILDEPTVGLDAIAKQELFSQLLAAVSGSDRSVLISSHGLADLERFADHVGMLRDGQLVFEGPMTDIVERFRMVDFEAREFACANTLSGFVLQERSGDRWRALIDETAVPLDRLTAMGARNIAASRVTLEDVFVALGRR